MLEKVIDWNEMSIIYLDRFMYKYFKKIRRKKQNKFW